MLRTATKHSYGPPRNRSVLGVKMITDLQAKITEYETVNRTYCHEQSCSTFIPPDQISERMAPCPACEEQTCATCKAQYHASPDCSAVHDEAFDEWRTENHAATCPGCKRVILLSQGCNHMRYFQPQSPMARRHNILITCYSDRCPCGSEFCYECSVTWKQCTCSRWHEERLLDRAAEVADRQGAGRPNEMQVQEAVEALRAEVDCRHNDWTRVDVTVSGSANCADCHWHARSFLWQCDDCGMRVCSRCRVDYRDFDYCRY
ncbi:hypothetical protein EDD36DRAFT_207470 [Exophiala viscosa]|uniref:IBR domain-containing protein n=1 Tax=Exophiala viscosa TaxID=2486360 RepID=A0AAN6DX09_9EURO|nr:hypothetical protein EDD36DRAFT_207470 [Exophiala viscosa]